MKSLTSLILGISLLATTTLAAPVEIDEIIPATANTVHARHITISAGATLGQRHASVVRAHVVRDLLKKRHEGMVAEAAASGTPAAPPPPAADSAAPVPPTVGTKPAGPTGTNSASGAAPSKVPIGNVFDAAAGPPGGPPGNKCTEANLLQCTINEWRDAEVCFVELCLN